jgi:hypothetical protein
MFTDGIGSLLGCDERRWCDGSGGDICSCDSVLSLLEPLLLGKEGV